MAPCGNLIESVNGLTESGIARHVPELEGEAENSGQDVMHVVRAESAIELVQVSDLEMSGMVDANTQTRKNAVLIEAALGTRRRIEMKHDFVPDQWRQTRLGR